MAADTFDTRPINVLRSSLAGLSSAWVLFLARISHEITFNPQASAHVQRCHLGFLFRSLQCGRRPLVGPLRKAAWSSGSLWPLPRGPWLLCTNRGFDARLSGGGSYEGQCRCAFLFYRQENISERTPRLLGRTVLCRLCNESGGSEAWGPHAHEPTCIVMCIVGT
jgi:hypothetical protein